AVHRADGPVPWVDRDERRRRVAWGVEAVGDGLLGVALHLRVERRRDLKPAAEDLALGVPIDQGAPRVVEEVAELGREVQADLDRVHLDLPALELCRALW